MFDLPPPAEPLLTTVGDIRLTASAAHTPTGAIPLRGATWHVHDQWWSERHIPTWAIVLAIVGFFCLTVLSLLFLLAKEDRTHGQAIVTVVNGDARYTTYVPVANGPQLQAVHQVVQYAQQLGTGHATG